MSLNVFEREYDSIMTALYIFPYENIIEINQKTSVKQLQAAWSNSKLVTSKSRRSLRSEMIYRQYFHSWWKFMDNSVHALCHPSVGFLCHLVTLKMSRSRINQSKLRFTCWNTGDSGLNFRFRSKEPYKNDFKRISSTWKFFAAHMISWTLDKREWSQNNRVIWDPVLIEEQKWPSYDIWMFLFEFVEKVWNQLENDMKSLKRGFKLILTQWHHLIGFIHRLWTEQKKI